MIFGKDQGLKGALGCHGHSSVASGGLGAPTEREKAIELLTFLRFPPNHMQWDLQNGR